MKYILTENKMNDLITKVLKSYEPEIVDVDFGTRRVKLASESETHKMGDIIDKTVIKVTVDNSDKHLLHGDYTQIYKGVKNILNKHLNIDVEEYGSLYDLEFFALEKIKKFG